ncbi:hypothetical protein LINPERPRIM_LOCUS34244 [Linum perenne]
MDKNTHEMNITKPHRNKISHTQVAKGRNRANPDSRNKLNKPWKRIQAEGRVKAHQGEKERERKASLQHRIPTTHLPPRGGPGCPSIKELVSPNSSPICYAASSAAAAAAAAASSSSFSLLIGRSESEEKWRQ